jgi:pyridinium-3,5-bisthiocarboxylic acid mononucleotide nickel chelatase
MSRLQRGLHLHLDPQSGIAGDMTVAALVDAGVPRAVVAEAVRAMGVRGLKVRFSRRKRGAFVGTGFEVTWPGMARPSRPKRGPGGRGQRARPSGGAHAHAVGDGHAHAHDQDHLILARSHHHTHDRDHEHDGHHHHDHDGGHQHGHDQANGQAHHEHRDYAEIRRLLKRAKLDADAKELAAEIFALVAQAEAALHGVSIDRIAFHEVGAYDSIADIVGAAAAIAWLAPASISASPVVVGRGSVRTAHGLVPVPAPATARLLAGAPIRAEGEGELTTPTGAAILAAVVDRFGPMPPLRLASQGLGAGTKELADRPNVLRVVLGEPLGELLPESAPSVTLLESNIDDMNPQLIEPLLAALFAAGAVDAWSAPILMKKGRPAFTVSALAPVEATDEVAQAFFENSTTIGLRTQALGRTVLARSRAEVKTPYGSVSVKVSALDGRVLQVTPEFEDCRRLAQAGRAPVRAVLAAASAAATHRFGQAGRKAGTRAKR